MRAILEIDNCEAESFPTCWEDLREGDQVRDIDLHQFGGTVIHIWGNRVLCIGGGTEYVLFRHHAEFYGMAGDLPDWIRA